MRFRWPPVALAFLLGCTYRVEPRKSAVQPLVVDEGAWLPTDAEASMLLGTHRLAPDVTPEARQIYRWLAMLLLAADGTFLGLERATFFNGEELALDPGYRNRRGTYALRRRSDGTHALVLTFAQPADDDPSSRIDLGSVTYLVRVGKAVELAYDDAGPEREDAYLPMHRDAMGVCAVAKDCAAQHADDGGAGWRCAVPTETLGPSFGACEARHPVDGGSE